MPSINPFKTAIIVCLLAVLTAPAASAEIPLSVVVALKEQAIDFLEQALTYEEPTGSTRNRLEKAIEAIDASLAEELWVDGLRLEPIDGRKVFDEAMKAIRELERLLDVGGPIAYAASEAISNLIDADAVLAKYAIGHALTAAASAGCEQINYEAYPDPDDDGDGDGDADGYPEEDCDCGKASRGIDRARDLRAEARELIGVEDGRAVDHFKKSWIHAVKAERAVSLCSVVYECPCEISDLFAPFVDGTYDISHCGFEANAMESIAETVHYTGAGAEALFVVGDEAACTASDWTIPSTLWLPTSDAQAQACITRLVAAVAVCPCSAWPGTSLPPCTPPE